MKKRAGAAIVIILFYIGMLSVAGAAEQPVERSSSGIGNRHDDTTGMELELNDENFLGGLSTEVGEEIARDPETALQVERVEDETMNAVAAELSAPETNAIQEKNPDIDELIARYRTTSQQHAYEVMNAIKEKIAAMNREEQRRAIEELQNVAKERSHNVQERLAPRTNVDKHSEKIRSKSRSVSHRASRARGRRNTAMDALSGRTHTDHMNPMDVLNGNIGGGGDLGGAVSPGGSFGGDMGSFGGDMGSFGGGMGDFGGGMGGGF